MAWLSYSRMRMMIFIFVSPRLLHTSPATIYRAVDTYPCLPGDFQDKQVVTKNTEATLLLNHSTNGIKIKVTPTLFIMNKPESYQSAAMVYL